MRIRDGLPVAGWLARQGVWFGLLAFSLLVSAQVSDQAEEEPENAVLEQLPGDYVSPYSVRFTFPESELIGDILDGRRGEVREQSSLPYYRWDSQFVRRRYGAWGPPARHFLPPEGVQNKSAAWKRERVIAVGLRFLGYEYQHHHIPDWNPPEHWPWLKAPSGHNGKGLDCSNFKIGRASCRERV